MLFPLYYVNIFCSTLLTQKPLTCVLHKVQLPIFTPRENSQYNHGFVYGVSAFFFTRNTKTKYSTSREMYKTVRAELRTSQYTALTHSDPSLRPTLHDCSIQLTTLLHQGEGEQMLLLSSTGQFRYPDHVTRCGEVLRSLLRFKWGSHRAVTLAENPRQGHVWGWTLKHAEHILLKHVPSDGLRQRNLTWTFGTWASQQFGTTINS
jgi:hypothetical protein